MMSKRYPCPVCCRFFARDRDLIECDDGRYVCESEVFDLQGCGFQISSEDIKNPKRREREVMEQIKKLRRL